MSIYAHPPQQLGKAYQKVSIDWPTIRLRFIKGETPYAISKSLGGRPTRQWIWRKARQEGWDTGLPGLVARKHLQAPLRSPTKDTPERRERIVQILSDGGTYRLAAAAVAISPDTLRRWRDDDPDFAALCAAAMSQFALQQLRKVASSKDAKDGRWLLERHPISREDFRQDRGPGGKLHISIRIPRSPAEAEAMALIEATPERRLIEAVSASVSD